MKLEGLSKLSLKRAKCVQDLWFTANIHSPLKFSPGLQVKHTACQLDPQCGKRKYVIPATSTKMDGETNGRPCLALAIALKTAMAIEGLLLHLLVPWQLDVEDSSAKGTQVQGLISGTAILITCISLVVALIAIICGSSQTSQTFMCRLRKHPMDQDPLCPGNKS